MILNKNKDQHIRMIRKLLNNCNMTYAQLQLQDEKDMEEKILNRLNRGDNIALSIDDPDSSPIEERVLLSGLYIMDIKTKMERYNRLLIKSSRIGPDVKYLCDKDGVNSAKLSHKWDILTRVTRGTAKNNDFDELADFLVNIPANIRNCLIAAFTGVVLRIDIILFIITFAMKRFC